MKPSLCKRGSLHIVMPSLAASFPVFSAVHRPMLATWLAQSMHMLHTDRGHEYGYYVEIPWLHREGKCPAYACQHLQAPGHVAFPTAWIGKLAMMYFLMSTA